MKLITLLHFYQPHNQQKDILDRIVNESYRPVTKGLLERPQSRIVVNIAGSLIELLLKHGYEDVLDNLKELAKRGQIEFTASSMYHAFLPLLPKEEIERQIDLNDALGKEVFGKDLYNPTGFFSPEMGINSSLLEVVSSKGFKWVSASQLAFPEGMPSCKTIYKDKATDLTVFFRQKRVSALVLSSNVKSASELIKETQDLHDECDYWFIVKDAETFGHHRIGHEKLLFDLMENPFFEPMLTSEFLKDSTAPVKKVEIRASTWTNEEQDFWLDQEHTKKTEAKSFILWDDPSNPIHRVQWKLSNYVTKCVREFNYHRGKNWKDARKKLDGALASDQYWWASAKPWWSLEMVELGAYTLKDVLYTLYEDKDSLQAKKAEEYYRKILDLSFEWQRSGHIRDMHTKDSVTYMTTPFKKRAPAEWYNQILIDLEAEMLRVAEEKNFEAAVKWRDAIYKIHQETDIYDVLHVVDEFWTARKIFWNKPFLERDWDEISDFVKGYLVEVNSKEDFEKWKKQSRI